MRWARACAVRLALANKVPYCVLEDYTVVELRDRPRGIRVLGVAYPQDYRFVYSTDYRTPLRSCVSKYGDSYGTSAP